MAKKKINIDQELEIIEQGRYGEDVRMAIHDALQKLNKTSGSTTNGMLVGPSTSYYRGCEGLVFPAGTVVSDSSIRITITNVRDNWESFTGAVAGFTLYDENNQAMTLPAGTVISAVPLEESALVGPNNAFDGNNNTDWRWIHDGEYPDTIILGFTFVPQTQFRPVKFSYTTNGFTPSSGSTVDPRAWDPTQLTFGYYDGEGNLIASAFVGSSEPYTPPSSGKLESEKWDINYRS